MPEQSLHTDVVNILKEFLLPASITELYPHDINSAFLPPTDRLASREYVGVGTMGLARRLLLTQPIVRKMRSSAITIPTQLSRISNQPELNIYELPYDSINLSRLIAGDHQHGDGELLPRALRSVEDELAGNEELNIELRELYIGSSPLAAFAISVEEGKVFILV